MAFDSMLAAQVRRVFEEFPEIEEKRMFGGVGFMADGNMACGVMNDDLIVRVGPEQYDQSLAEPHTREFDITGRPMKVWVMVGPQGWTDHQALRQWVLNGLEFALTLPQK